MCVCGGGEGGIPETVIHTCTQYHGDHSLLLSCKLERVGILYNKKKKKKEIFLGAIVSTLIG